MGIREYLNRTAAPNRWKVSALLAFGLHAGIFLVGSVVMATQAQYGMAGAVAGGGQPRPPAPVEQTIELENDPDEAPQEHHSKPKPTPVVPTGIGGKVSGQTSEIPAYYRNPPPPYPLGARVRKEEGVVLVHAEVDAHGMVASVSLVQSCGFTDLDEAALGSVKDWQFKPAQVAGIPIATSVNVPIRFRLKDIR